MTYSLHHVVFFVYTLLLHDDSLLALATFIIAELHGLRVQTEVNCQVFKIAFTVFSMNMSPELLLSCFIFNIFIAYP
jgi:hypothetical protein